MARQLCWISRFNSNGKLALHIRFESFHPWKPHTAFPELCVPDYPIPGGSHGWATSQKLLQGGWTMVSTKQAQRSFDRPISSSMNPSDDDQLAA
jgi:hypothetical protein